MNGKVQGNGDTRVVGRIEVENSYHSEVDGKVC